VAINLDQKKQDALRQIEAFRNDWREIVLARSVQERAKIVSHMRWCLEELTGLVRDLEADIG
jgi:hypothetical protein